MTSRERWEGTLAEACRLSRIDRRRRRVYRDPNYGWVMTWAR